MSPSRPVRWLDGYQRVGLDTCVFIYQLDGASRRRAVVQPLFAAIEEGRVSAVTSTITMLELLVQPYRMADLDNVNRIYALLSTYPNLDWLETTLAMADHAARLRADHGLATPDAIQVATAVAGSADAFISNDVKIKRAVDLPVILVDDLVG